MNSLDKQRVNVGYSKNAYSASYNLKASHAEGVCQSHKLTKDVYGREVGDLGVKRYDDNCGNKFDATQNLSSILERENKQRPSILGKLDPMAIYEATEETASPEEFASVEEAAAPEEAFTEDYTNQYISPVMYRA